VETDLNLLFLPLLGGYIFYTRFNLTAYSAVRTHGQHLLFRVAALGRLHASGKTDAMDRFF